MLMSAIRKLREKWRIRRERIKRLNAARSGRGSDHATPYGGSGDAGGIGIGIGIGTGIGGP
jgi:hypothetical protein